MHYVYELINLYGSIEDVGETTRPKIRMFQHTKTKPRDGHGKYYGRQDLIMNIVAEFDNRKDALKLEGKLKLEYGLPWTESIRSANNGRKSAIKRSKSVIAYKKDGSFIREYKSQVDCAIDLNLTRSKVVEVCKGILVQTKGYTIKYKEI